MRDLHAHIERLLNTKCRAWTYEHVPFYSSFPWKIVFKALVYSTTPASSKVNRSLSESKAARAS